MGSLVWCERSVQRREEGVTRRAYRTNLGLEVMRPIIWLDEHDLVLVCDV